MELKEFIEKYIETTDLVSHKYKLSMDDSGQIIKTQKVGIKKTSYRWYCNYCYCSIHPALVKQHAREHLKDV